MMVRSNVFALSPLHPPEPYGFRFLGPQPLPELVEPGGCAL